MNRLRHILSVLLVCLLICSMSITAFATGEQGGNTTLTANVPAAVTYDANGGSGTMEADSVAVGGELTLPQCGFTAPGGKQFKCLCSFTQRQQAILKAGGLLNYTKEGGL